MAQWYRGIAPGAPTSSPTDVHDLGPGTYLTDTLDVARAYASLRVDASNSAGDRRTVYGAVLYGEIAEGSLGSVLDLTSGPHAQAWRQFEQTPRGPMTNRQIMTSNPSTYGPMFKEWATGQGLNLNSYTAIIGPEYLRGGKQMCIRNPEVADRVLKGFVGRSLHAPPPPPALPSPQTLTYSVRGQANASAIVVIFMAVDVLANYYNANFQEEAVKNAKVGDMKSIRDWQEQHPDDGALLVITFRRTVNSSEFMQNRLMIQPGDAFEYSSLFFAPTPEEAIKQMAREKEIVEVDVVNGPYKTIRRKQAIWITPRIPAESVTISSPAGKWHVTIGDWKGWFTFGGDGSCSWSETGGAEHKGTWKYVGNEMQWSYNDDPPGWQRIFHARLPLQTKASGQATIRDVNHGYYKMSKTS